jgi:hypothetical protein
VLSSQVVVGIRVGGPGTASEAALAIKSRRPVILLAPTAEAKAFFLSLGGTVLVADSPEEVCETIKARRLLDR